MPEPEKTKTESESLAITSGPLVFISHDGRDADLAEAFAKLLKSVSAGMIKTFRSSDKKGTEGIDFGEEWYKRLMTALQSTSDVVCLFTERSLDRPWILFEAGVAKGKLGTPVVGVALGVSLSRISAGPFYQFQNMDDSEDDLTKLVNQLARRVPGLELDPDVVKQQVAAFRSTEKAILEQRSPGGSVSAQPEDNPVAKLLEEMKSLPARVAERLPDPDEQVMRRRRLRRVHPMMLQEVMMVSLGHDDPSGILIAASFFRDDAPWLYELTMEAYRVAKSGRLAAIDAECSRLRDVSELMARSPLLDDLGIRDQESYILVRDFPMLLHEVMRGFVGRRKRLSRRRQPATQSDRS